MMEQTAGRAPRRIDFWTPRIVATCLAALTIPALLNSLWDAPLDRLAWDMPIIASILATSYLAFLRDSRALWAGLATMLALAATVLLNPLGSSLGSLSNLAIVSVLIGLLVTSAPALHAQQRRLNASSIAVLITIGGAFAAIAVANHGNGALMATEMPVEAVIGSPAPTVPPTEHIRP